MMALILVMQHDFDNATKACSAFYLIVIGL